MRVVVAVAGAHARRLADALREEGADVRAVVGAGAPASAVADAMSGPEAAELLAELSRAEVLVLDADRATLTADLVGACDRFGVRIAPLCAREADRRLVAMFGLRPCAPEASELLRPPSAALPAEPERGRVVAVWGPAGAPGRTTIAIELACELSRDGRRVGLVDADSHSPSVAMASGLPDEGPGFAAACRQAERGGLSPAELTRIAVPLSDIEVLTGINRGGRWPELAQARVTGALEACRAWVDDTVVDVAAALDRDEEIVSDLDGPRRNAATLAVLAEADLVVAVAAADPVGISRFVRAYPELRAAAGPASVRVVVNKTRRGPLGIDAQGQVRRTLERFAGVGEAWFVPWDGKAVDAAMLTARPVAHSSPRSALTAAVRRFVGEAIEPPVARTRRERGQGRMPARIPRTA